MMEHLKEGGRTPGKWSVRRQRSKVGAKMLCTKKGSEMYGDGRESDEQMNVRKGDEKRRCGGRSGRGRIFKIRNIYYHFMLFVMKNHLLLPNY